MGYFHENRGRVHGPVNDSAKYRGLRGATAVPPGGWETGAAPAATGGGGGGGAGGAPGASDAGGPADDPDPFA